jgi:taurine dioxygenase
MANSIRVIPMDAALGADVIGFDIKKISAEEAAVVRKAWLQHLVLRIRGQDFDDDDHLDFARKFGGLQVPARVIHTGKGLHQGHAEISVISNIRENGVVIGSLGDGELAWHTDMSFIDRPPAGSMLHALEVPERGGDTSFLNMYKLYEDLPAALKTMITGKFLKHEEVHASNLKVRVGKREPESGSVVDYPGKIHPLVRTHPETGKPALYLGRRLNAYIMDLPVDESEDILDQLWTHTDDPAYSVTQIWQVGDLIIWDNRCTMHKRNSFAPALRRRMHRCVIEGDKPFYAQ